MSVVFPVICICLLFASLISYSSEVTGLILNLNLAARNVLAADIVAPESGSDNIWLVLVPCTIVNIILGVADDSMFTFPVWLIVDIISCCFVFLRCEMSVFVFSISVVVLFLNSSMFVCSCFICCICRLF